MRSVSGKVGDVDGAVWRQGGVGIARHRSGNCRVVDPASAIPLSYVAAVTEIRIAVGVEKNLRGALKTIDKLAEIKDKSVAIRIEGV